MKNRAVVKQAKHGIALVIVMMTLALMSVLAIEIIFASRVDLRIGRNARDRLQAFYLAESSLRFALIRIYLYREVQNTLGGTPGAGQAMNLPTGIADKIWSMPLPSFPLPGMKADWPGEFSVILESEGSKIPINLLDGNKNRMTLDPATAVKSVREQIDGIFKGLAESDEFDKLYRGLDPKDLIDPLQDWINPQKEKLTGGEKESDYSRFDPPYKPRMDRMPGLGELHMVRGWTDDLIDRVAKNFSVYNMTLDVNPNYMDLTRIKALCSTLTPEDLTQIQKKRTETPFSDLNSFFGYITSSGDIKSGRNCKFPQDMTMRKRETIFVVEGTGVVGEARRSLKMAVKILETPPPPTANQNGSTTSSSTPPPATSTTTGNSSQSTQQTKLLDPVIISIEEGA